jgi:hypothetical protein
VGDVGEELPARAVGRLERLAARRELGGHLVERVRERADFVAAALVGAIVAFTGAVFSFALVRQSDFVGYAAQPAAAAA